MKQGRPVGSIVRDRLAELLQALGPMHGYALVKHYNALWTRVTPRLVYYHLHKGLDTGLFCVHKSIKQQGTYSWGGVSEITLYAPGPNNNSKVSPLVKAYLKEHALKNRVEQ